LGKEKQRAAKAIGMEGRKTGTTVVPGKHGKEKKRRNPWFRLKGYVYLEPWRGRK